MDNLCLDLAARARLGEVALAAWGCDAQPYEYLSEIVTDEMYGQQDRAWFDRHGKRAVAELAQATELPETMTTALHESAVYALAALGELDRPGGDAAVVALAQRAAPWVREQTAALGWPPAGKRMR